MPLSDVVREALERYAGTDQPSIWEAGRHVFEAGAWRGPKDLSTNRRHLKGYGR